MCSAIHRDFDVPAWLHALQRWAWRNRNTVAPVTTVAVILAVFVGALVYCFTPTDIERAQADDDRAWQIILSVENEANVQQRESRAHRKRAADFQKAAAGSENDPDVEWVEHKRVMATECARLAAAASERRDHLVRLASDYRRRVGEAEREILRAKTARECGTPYEVAPRVRGLLRPILSNH